MAIQNATPGQTKIGWIGTGVMGGSMCRHLMEAGFSATVYTRTPKKAQALLDQGAHWADSPRAVAEQSDIVFAIVGFPATCAKSSYARSKELWRAANPATSSST